MRMFLACVRGAELSLPLVSYPLCSLRGSGPALIITSPLETFGALARSWPITGGEAIGGAFDASSALNGWLPAYPRSEPEHGPVSGALSVIQNITPSFRMSLPTSGRSSDPRLLGSS
jgi:hypothetical protein